MEEKFMSLAINEAKKSLKNGEMPVGTVIVCNNKVISKGKNMKEKTKSSISHSEIAAINKACKKNKNWRLNECEIYITLEPCLMCMGAIIESRIKKIYCSVENKKTHDLNLEICKKENININYGLLQDESTYLLDAFFKKIRNK